MTPYVPAAEREEGETWMAVGQAGAEGRRGREQGKERERKEKTEQRKGRREKRREVEVGSVLGLPSFTFWRLLS